MKLTLTRKFKGNQYTIGSLCIDDKWFCDTLEDVDRGLTLKDSLTKLNSIKVKDSTAIPTGTYTIDMQTVSPRFKNTVWAKKYNGIVPRLLNVPAYAGVLIHPGNTAKDTSGCILVGENKVKGQVINSLKTWHALMLKLLTSKNITLTIN